MKFGHFDDPAREYVIETPRTPLPWINYLGSEDVIFRYLVIFGPVRREDAIELAKKMRADSLERRLRNTGINPHNCTAEQKDLLKAIIASNKTDFKVLQEKQCVEEYPDSYEYFIVRDIFARTKK